MTINVLTTTDQALHKAADAQQKSTEISDRVREVSEATERPWIGPGTAGISGKVEKDKPVKFIVGITNTGRQPALLNTYASIHVYGADDWQREIYRADALKWEADCIERKFNDKEPTRLLFPGERFNSYKLVVNGDEQKPPIVGTDPLVSGDDRPVLFGCFVYQAFGNTRHTSFCYYQSKGFDLTDIPFCPVGQYAD